MTNQAPLVSSSAPQIVRQSVNYHPNLWENEFLTSPDFKENDEDNMKLLELKKEINRMLMNDTVTLSEKLDLIDEMQRLGTAYHFESEINEILKYTYQGQHFAIKDDYGDFGSTSLQFRLLRQHGYIMSTEVFNKFKGSDGNFKECLTTDVKGILSLYEASYLRMSGENILDEALDFTRKHLESMAYKIGINTSLARQIHHVLERPLRKGVPRIEARIYMPIYEENPLHYEKLLAFAKLDFNMLQKVHQKELSDIVRWWTSLGFARKLPFTRDRVVELYFWILGFYFEPKNIAGRKILTKVIAMLSVIDDIYDVYGSFEELELFTKAIERWDINAINILPEYMKYCYDALLDVYKEIEEDVASGDNSYRLYYAKEAMKYMVRNYFVEATWCHHDYVPTMEEYMQAALATSGSLTLGAISFLGMGEIATKESFEWLFSNPKIVKACSLVSRLMDDVATHKLERERKHVPSAVECYMKQYGSSEEETVKLLHKEVENAWKDINEEYVKPTVPVPLLDLILNFARTIDFLYKDKDFYCYAYLMKDHVASLLKDPVPI